MLKTFDSSALYSQLGLQDGPLIVDLRTAAELEGSGEFIPSAVRVDPRDRAVVSTARYTSASGGVQLR